MAIWERQLPSDPPAAMMAALGLDRTERLTTPASLCEGCSISR